MLPKTHIILGAIFSLLVYFIFNLSLYQVLIIFSASVLIDLDHFLFYVKRHRNTNLKKAYFWHKALPKDHKPMMHIFHSLEFLIIIGILSIFYNFFLMLFIGFIFHSIFDLIDMIYNGKYGREFFFFRFLILDKKRYF